MDTGQWVPNFQDPPVRHSTSMATTTFAYDATQPSDEDDVPGGHEDLRDGLGGDGPRDEAPRRERGHNL